LVPGPFADALLEALPSGAARRVASDPVHGSKLLIDALCRAARACDAAAAPADGPAAAAAAAGALGVTARALRFGVRLDADARGALSAPPDAASATHAHAGARALVAGGSEAAAAGKYLLVPCTEPDSSEPLHPGGGALAFVRAGADGDAPRRVARVLVGDGGSGLA
jgi:hypothetical protein